MELTQIRSTKDNEWKVRVCERESKSVCNWDRSENETSKECGRRASAAEVMIIRTMKEQR